MQRTNLRRVVCRSKDQFRCTVVPGADVRHVGLILDQDLCAAEITQLQNARSGVKQQVLGFDVPVADSLRVDVGERAEQLVDVELDFEDGHDRLHLVEVARSAVNRLGNKLEHEIQIHLVLLYAHLLAASRTSAIQCGETYTLAIVVEEGLELDDVGMPDNAHDLQLAVLVTVSADASTHLRHTRRLTLKRLSCSTRLIAASSPLGESLV